MANLFSYIFGTSNDTDPESQDHDEKIRAKDSTTYAFLLSIIGHETSDYKEKSEVEIVALYNESCKYNYLSARFARERLHIRVDDSKHEGDKLLVWTCPGLGRFQQRTVFWIADHAEFDILFGFEKDFNVPPNQTDQFRRGIEQKVLKEQASEKSFQSGVNTKFLLPLERAEYTAVPNSNGELNQIPTLAEINHQLAQLDSSQERKQAHELKRALNTFPPNSTNLEAVMGLQGDSGYDTDGNTYIVSRLRSDPPRDTKIVKGNKRCHPEQVISSPAAEECPRSPKLRLVRRKSVRIQLATPPASIQSSPNPRNLDLTNFKEHSTEPVILGITKDELLVGMDRCTSPPEQAPHGYGTADDASIKLPSSSSSLVLERKRILPPVGYSVKRVKPKPARKKKNGRKKRSKKHVDWEEEIHEFSSSADWSEKMFDDYWTLDKKAENYFHIDKVTNTKTWYEAPKSI